MCAVSVPCLYVLMRLFGTAAGDDHHANDQNVVLALYKHYGESITRLKIILRQIFKFLQLVAVISTVDVSWPAETRVAFQVAGLTGMDYDVLAQVGCLEEQQTYTLGMVMKWILPIMFLILIVVSNVAAYPFVFGISAARRSGARVKVVDVERCGTFVYMLWSAFFAGLVRNSFMLLVCKKNPNGKFSVTWYPEMYCYEGDWNVLLPGAVAASCLYVVLFFVFSIWAVRQVAKALVGSGCTDGGAFLFLIEGLRCSSIHWNIYTAGRDVSLNVAVAVFAGQGTSQLLAGAGILAFYALATYEQKPFEALSLNFVEVWTSAGLTVFVVFVAAFGLQNSDVNLKALSESTVSGEADYDSRPMWLVGILILSVAAPVLVMVFEVASMIPAVARLMPPWFRPVSKDLLAARKAKVQAWLGNTDVSRLVAEMDNVELRSFLYSVNGSPLCEALERTGPSKKISWTLHDPVLSRVTSRSSLLARAESSAAEAPQNGDSNADLALYIAAGVEKSEVV